jgi:hypothetical protein
VNPLPFLVLALGGWFTLIVWAARDNRVRRPTRPSHAYTLLVAPAFFAVARRAVEQAAAFEAAFERLRLALRATRPQIEQLVKEMQAAFGTSSQAALEQLSSIERTITRKGTLP